jgi:membrane protease YdiL (CAAX protease family)
MHEDRDEVGGGVRLVPWTAGEILVAFVTVSFFWPAAAFQLLHVSGFYHRLYGDEAATLAWSDPDRSKQQRLALGALAGPGAADAALPVLRNQAFYRLNLWAMVLAFPFQVATIPVLLRGASGTQPEQLGLTARRLGRNLLAGAVGAVVLTPLVLGLNALVEELYREAGAGGLREHPLTQVARQELAPVEWVLFFLTPLVVAPVVEELLFRGLLQPWLAVRRWGGHAAMTLALVQAVLTCGSRARDAWPLGAGPFLEQAAPVVFVLALVPIYLAVCRLSRTPVPRAIFGTALVFAYVHAGVWPSPVALFLLALGLGVLAWRTRSLAGPILLHSLFNGVSCLRLFFWG